MKIALEVGIVVFGFLFGFVLGILNVLIDPPVQTVEVEKVVYKTQYIDRDILSYVDDCGILKSTVYIEPCNKETVTKYICNETDYQTGYWDGFMDFQKWQHEYDCSMSGRIIMTYERFGCIPEWMEINEVVQQRPGLLP